jgi:hypothetical protein
MSDQFGSITTGVQIVERDKGLQEDQTQMTDPMAEQTEPSVDEDEIRQYVLDCKKESEDAYRELRLTWDSLWDAAQSKADYSKKEDWQAKVFVPEFGPAIKKATSLLCRILFKTDNYIELDPGLIKDEALPGKIENPFLAGQKLAIRYWMDQAKAEQLFKEWIECAFTYGIGYLKWWWEPLEKKRLQARNRQVVEVTKDAWGNPMIQRRYDSYYERETYQSSVLAGKVIEPKQIYTDLNHTWYIE